MRVLVTGASGFLGRHALDALAQAGAQVVTLGRTAPRHDAIVDAIHLDLLLDPPTPDLLARAGATHLLHLAWFAEHGAFWTSPLNLRWVEASIRLVEAFCQAGGRHVVAAGTCAEYGAAEGLCDETLTPPAPTTVYGVAKDATRRLCEAICAAHGARLAWARPFFTYGAGEDARRLVPALVRSLRGGQSLAINLQARRDLLHVEDLARALVVLLQSPVPGPVNVCSGQPIALGELVAVLAGVLGADPAPVLRASRLQPGEPSCIAGDNGRLRATGWSPRFDLAAGLAHLLAEAAPARPPRPVPPVVRPVPVNP